MKPVKEWPKAIRSFLGYKEGQKPPLRDRLLVTIGTLAIIWYFVSIVIVSCSDRKTVIPVNESESGSSTPRVPSRIPIVPFVWSIDHPLPEELLNFMAFSITTISGTLATYLGLVLGFGQVQENLTAQQGAIQPNVGANNSTALPLISPIQTIAAWCYVGSLVLALFLWAYKLGVDETIVNLGRSILGLFGGVLAVVLNVPQRSNRQ